MGNINNINQNDIRFNAVSGMLSNNSAKPQTLQPSKFPAKSQRSILIDDYLPSSKAHQRLMPSLKLASQISQKPKTVKLHSSVAPHDVRIVKAHQPEAASTLMRKGLPKPTTKERVKHFQAALAQSTPKTISPHEQIHRHHARHALAVKRDYRISRFGRKEIAKANNDLKVQPMNVKLPLYGSGVAAANDITLNPALPAKSVEHRRAANNRYKKHHQLHRRRHRLFIVTIIFLILLVLAYIFYLLTPAIDVKVASIHAGIPAQLPNYHPTDYAFKAPVRYSAGIVNISYKSKNSSQTYSIVLQSSHWDSQILKTDYIATLNEPYSTVMENNRTIYVYGTGQAAWINNGVLYQISGNADLSQPQLLNIANSI